MASKAAPKKKAPKSVTYICRQCFDDEALPETDQFGKPRGFDIRGLRPESPALAEPYCGTCGEDHSLERVKL